MRFASSFANERNAWEGLLEREGPLGVIHGHSIELLLVALHLLDEVDEVAWLLELLEVFSIDHVTKLILHANDQLDHIEGVETVCAELGVEANCCLSCGSKVVFSDGDDIPLNLVVRLQNKSVLGRVNLCLPEVDFTSLFVLCVISASDKCVIVQSKVLEVAHLLGGGHEGGGTAHKHGASLAKGSESDAAQHF